MTGPVRRALAALGFVLGGFGALGLAAGASVFEIGVIESEPAIAFGISSVSLGAFAVGAFLAAVAWNGVSGLPLAFGSVLLALGAVLLAHARSLRNLADLAARGGDLAVSGQMAAVASGLLSGGLVSLLLGAGALVAYFEWRRRAPASAVTATSTSQSR